MLFSCSNIIYKLYGIEVLQEVDEQRITSFYAGIDLVDLNHQQYLIDSTQFEIYRRVGKTDRIKKDMSQPVQILYFINDRLASFHANCYAKGSLKNIDFNYNGRFDQFIPTSATDSLPSYTSLTELGEKLNIEPAISQKNITIIVLWTSMFENMAKSGIEEVLINLENFEQKENVKIHFINNDDFYAKLD